MDIQLDNKGAEDSYSFLDEIIEGTKVSDKRDSAIDHSARGELAIRQDDWVFINSKESRDNEEPDWFKEKIGVVPHNEDFELFNLKKDGQQTKNLVKVYPGKAEELRILLEKYIEGERTIVR